MSSSPIDDFVRLTSKSTVAVIIPLYGYWNDVPNNPVNGEALNAVLKQVYSMTHQLILIFVANPETLPNDVQEKESVVNILASKNAAGNVKMVPVPRTAGYVDYLREGMDAALEDTNAQFIAFINPWVFIQDGGIDALIERVNRADDAKMVSGSDVHALVPAEQFDTYRNDAGTEKWDINFDFLATPRYTAELVKFDDHYKTHGFLQLDIFQGIRRQGFGVLSSERIPIYSFDFPWKTIESQQDFELDRAYFKEKWGFDPGISYE